MKIINKDASINDLVIRSGKNDAKAQLELYNIYCHTMFNASFRILNDRFCAEDVIQDAFLTAFEKIAECRIPEHFGAWLKRIVINRSIDELRKRKIKFSSLDENIIQPEEAYQDLLEEEKTQEDLLKYVSAGIRLLPEGYRIVLVLKLIEGYAFKDIAKETGITESSVRSQYVRGKQTLIRVIEKMKQENHGQNRKTYQ